MDGFLARVFLCGEVGHRGCDCPRRVARKGKGLKGKGKKGDGYKGHKGKGHKGAKGFGFKGKGNWHDSGMGSGVDAGKGYSDWKGGSDWNHYWGKGRYADRVLELDGNTGATGNHCS